MAAQTILLEGNWQGETNLQVRWNGALIPATYINPGLCAVSLPFGMPGSVALVQVITPSGTSFALGFPYSNIAAAGVNFLLSQTESWLNVGNVSASIADGNFSTLRVGYTGAFHDTDWWAVSRSDNVPFLLKKVTYGHGHCYADGGWFDTSSSPVYIDVQIDSNTGSWSAIGTLTAYPATTNISNGGLTDGQAITETLATALSVYGVRIRGVPGGTSYFGSCAEIQAFSS